MNRLEIPSIVVRFIIRCIRRRHVYEYNILLWANNLLSIRILLDL